MKKHYLLLVLILGVWANVGLAENVRWSDGRVGDKPQGKLISDNLGYYGDVILTGATYEYLSPIKDDHGDGKADTDKVYRGKRLQDGDLNGNPVNKGFGGDLRLSPLLASPAKIVFDFKKTCDFYEIDLKMQEGQYGLLIETSEDKKTWHSSHENKVLIVASSKIVRLKLPAKTGGQYLKLTVKGKGDFWLSEVYVWGACVQDDVFCKTMNMNAVYDTFVSPSIPGIQNTQTDDVAFARWKNRVAAAIGPLPQVVCLQVPAWGFLTRTSILPEPNRIGSPISLTMVRNETEPFCLAMTNTDYFDDIDTDVSMSPFRDAGGKVCPLLTGDIYVMGALNTQQFGVQMVPLFSATNKPGRDIIRKYCTNGGGIMDFPKLSLSKAGSALLWIKVKSHNCAPGNYSAKLSCKNGNSVDIRVNVIDVTLKDVNRFVNFWPKTFDQYPFRSLDWMENNAEAMLEIGSTVAPYSINEEDLDPNSLNNILKRKQPNTLFGLWMGQFGGKLYAAGGGDKWGQHGISHDDATAIKADINNIAAFAKSRGLKYDQWYLDTADETNSKNLKLFGEVMKIAKDAQPEMMIVCNPCGWQNDPKHPFESDDLLHNAMKDWYEKYIDISVPAVTLTTYDKCGRLFSAKRKFNAFYEVVTSRSKAENYECVNMPRHLVWQAIKLNCNGWAMFSYQSAFSNPWDDFDSSADFYLVLPGPNGPIPTRAFEAAREGYEDFMLMSQLKTKNPAVYQEVIADFCAGTEFDRIREKIYRGLLR